MKVSVITTFYNDSGTLKRALDSVVAQQTGHDLEYVVVNDRGGDGAEWLFEGWYRSLDASLRSRVRYFCTPRNLGCGGARRFGIERATGEALMFLDADDFYLRTDFVEQAANRLTQTEADIVCFGAQYHTGYGAGEFKEHGVKAVEELEGEAAFFRLFRSNDIRFNVWDKIFRRYLAEEVPYSEAPRLEDMRTVPLWMLRARKVVLAPEVMVYYAFNPRSIIRKDGVRTRLDTMAASLDLMRLLPEAERRQAVYDRVQPDIVAVVRGESPQTEAYRAALRYDYLMLNELGTYKNNE